VESGQKGQCVQSQKTRQFQTPHIQNENGRETRGAAIGGQVDAQRILIGVVLMVAGCYLGKQLAYQIYLNTPLKLIAV
jgi:hypothetical protein